MDRNEIEDNMPLHIVRRRLHIKQMIIDGNNNFKNEKKLINRKYVMNGCLYLKKKAVSIDESKNTIYIF